MPSVSKAQQRLMAAAEHGAEFGMARRLRQSLTLQQLHEFATGSMTGKPTHARKRKSPHTLGALAQRAKGR